MSEHASRTRRNDRLALAAVLAFALAIKLLHLNGMVVDTPFRVDALQYAQTAVNIADHGVFGDAMGEEGPSINRLPGYPLLLSPLWSLTRDVNAFYHWALLLNVVLGLASVVLMYALARALFSTGVAVAVSALLALNPHVLAMEGYVLTETVFLFEMLLLLWIARVASRSGSTVAWVALGAVVGYSLLTRPSFLLFLPFAALLFLLLKVERKAVRDLALKGGLGMLIVMAPWFAYTQVQGVPFTGTKQDSITFAAGLYPNFVHEDPRYYGVPYRDPAAPDIHHDNMKALAQLGEWFREDPARYASWFLIGKPMALWQWDTVQGQGDVFIYEVSRSVFVDDPLFRAVKAVYRAVYPAMVVLMLLGLVLVLVRRPAGPMLYAAAIVLYFVGIHIVFFSLPRYSIPLRPMMLLLDAYALQWLYRRYAATRSKAPGKAAAG